MNVWCKKNRILAETFFSYQFRGSTPPLFKLWPNKWDLHEGYGGTNLGEKRVSIVSTFIV